jgi:hypothetical protein
MMFYPVLMLTLAVCALWQWGWWGLPAALSCTVLPALLWWVGRRA